MGMFYTFPVLYASVVFSEEIFLEDIFLEESGINSHTFFLSEEFCKSAASVLLKMH